MRSVFIFIFTFFLLFSACDKKVKDYAAINLFNYDDSVISLSKIEGDYRVFVFLSPECPLSENYSRTLLSLQDNFSDEGVIIYYVFPGTFYHKEQILQFLKTYHLPVEKSLFDPKYQLRDYCAATITPEAFLIDWAGTIVYSGAIDNWAITLGKQRQVISEHYLKDAIVSLLNDQEIKVSKTRAVGCIIE